MALELLDAAARQAAAVESTEHRRWPLPTGAWLGGQSWVDLAFLHWRVDPAELRPLVPRTLELETFDGAAWIGFVPFRLTALRVRGLPPVPRLSTFAELNVRTYVTREERPGVWFFSLDAASGLFVEIAKRLYLLPYHRADMSHERIGDRVHFETARLGAAFSGSYRGIGPPRRAAPGSLEHFLTERYCLYTENGGRAYRAEIHHPPWELQSGEANVDLNTMSPVPLPDAAPHVLFAPRQDVVVWRLAEL